MYECSVYQWSNVFVYVRFILVRFSMSVSVCQIKRCVWPKSPLASINSILSIYLQSGLEMGTVLILTVAPRHHTCRIKSKPTFPKLSTLSLGQILFKYKCQTAKQHTFTGNRKVNQYSANTLHNIMNNVRIRHTHIKIRKNSSKFINTINSDKY
uniref:Uncharacterized protein n=1 Tax=Strigamia maritima TaxID=126957 RepID=T1IHQ0_STRMM